MKFFKKTDLIIIFTIFILSITAWGIYNYAFAKDKLIAEIYYNSTLVKTVPLYEAKEQTFKLDENNHVTFHLYEDGSIAFEDSNCPDKVCINEGRLSRAGEFAACLPNGLVMKIMPASENYEDENADIIL